MEFSMKDFWNGNRRALARAITIVEDERDGFEDIMKDIKKEAEKQLNILASYTKEGEYPSLEQQYQNIFKKVEARMTTLKYIFGGLAILYGIGMAGLFFCIFFKNNLTNQNQSL